MKAHIICDTIWENTRITTFELQYWRAIHSEILTHRDRSRNSSSSRAIPFLKLGDSIEYKGIGIDSNCTAYRILTNMVIPKYIGSEKPGMVMGDRVEGAEPIIRDMGMYVLDKCIELYKLGVHKSIINRYLEPYTEIRTLMTSTNWGNFWKLRCANDCEPHFRELACNMRQIMENNTPDRRPLHAPYDSDFMVSVVCCARISTLNTRRDVSLFYKLIKNGHWSPFEHYCFYVPGNWGCKRNWKSLREYYEVDKII